MMPRRLAVVTLVAVLCSAAPAWAQSSGNDGLGARVFVHFEGQSMTAKRSFDAVAGTSTVNGVGGGLEVQNLVGGLFVRGAMSRLSKTGERVFVLDGEVFRLGIPLKITMTPIEVGAGWRFKPISGIVAYVGAGALMLKYREESPGDDPGEGVDESYNGVAVFGGFEVPVFRYASVGAEVGWRKATVTQPGGAFAVFNEKDLGGVNFRVMFSLRY